jgi:HK97 family phage prohead protease
MRHTKDFRFKLKTANGTGSFTGLAAVYGNVDLGNDQIERGAFKQTLLQNSNYPLLWQHRSEQPIGMARLSDSNAGLAIDGQLLLDVPEAQTAYSLLKAGVVKGLSIGYDAVRDSIDAAGIRHLEELRLWEVSIVTFPMNEAATVASVKSLDDARRILSDAAKSSDAEQIAQLRGLLKDITQLLLPADECECGAEDEEDCTCDEDAEDEKQATRILQELAFELKGHAPRAGLRW